MVGMALTKSLYAIPTWTRTVALVREHAALRLALGCGGEPPSVYACYRFSAKLVRYQHFARRLHRAGSLVSEDA
jgi:hypothetical protein